MASAVALHLLCCARYTAPGYLNGETKHSCEADPWGVRFRTAFRTAGRVTDEGYGRGCNLRTSAPSVALFGSLP